MKLKINGGSPLIGTVTVSGSKNAALPIIFSTLLIRGTTEIENLPDIGDTRVALKLIENMGGAIFRSQRSVFINTDKASYRTPDEDLVSKIRASTYLIGACLARFGRCDLCRFGGCNFSSRPIDLHLFAASVLGADVTQNDVSAKRLVGGEIILSKASVGATVNAILMAQGACGVTVIRGFAKEPHILALVNFLNSCGGRIRVTDDSITVTKSHLMGTKTAIIGDMIEAGTYACAAVATGGRIKIRGIEREEISRLLAELSVAGADVDEAAAVTVGGETCRKMSVLCGPYPEFPTDLQPIVASVMAKCGGNVTDKVFPERFGYLDALSLFGVESLRIPSGAIIYPSVPRAAKATAPDLRGGAACLIAALSSRGYSEIDSAEIIMRGYEGLASKLRDLGADVSEE